MKKTFAIIVLGALASGCTQSRVISDNSVAAQFSRLDGIGGARVTVGNRPVAPQMLPPMASNGKSMPVSNPFANAVWSTNLHVTAPASTGSTITTSDGGTIQTSGTSKTTVGGVTLPGGITIQPPGSPPTTIGVDGAVIPPTTITPGVKIDPINPVLKANSPK